MEKRKKKTGYQKTLEFLKKYEGFKDTTYLDGNGIPTIGYGFTDPELVAKGYISRADADKRLEQEVMSREKELRSKIKNWANLSDDSKTALLSYYFNYPAGFKDTTRFMQNWNAGNYEAAIREVDAGMNDPNNPGLRPRRLAEQELLNSDPYLTGIKTTTTGDGNKKMIFPRSWKEPEQMETWIPKITNPQYPLNPADRAPESIDSWNGAQSPSKGPMMPSLQKQMDERKRMYDFFGENAVATGKKKMIPSMSSMLSRNMENYISGILGIPDVYEDAGYTYTPMMYSPMPKFADGKLPKYEDGYLGSLANFGIGMIPIVGSAYDTYQAIKDPSLVNILSAGAGWGLDAMMLLGPAGVAIRYAGKAALKAKRAADAGKSLYRINKSTQLAKRQAATAVNTALTKNRQMDAALQIGQEIYNQYK